MSTRTEFDRQLVEMMPEMLGLSIRRLRSKPEAEDLVQRAALRALSAWQQFEPGTNFRAWMHRILYNEMLSQYRRQKRAPLSLDEADVGSAAIASRQDELMDQELVKRAMRRMPPSQAHVLQRICVEGRSYEEAAAEISVSVGTIKSRLWRARTTIEQMLVTS